jgi:hypothetical protein
VHLRFRTSPAVEGPATFSYRFGLRLWRYVVSLAVAQRLQQGSPGLSRSRLGHQLSSSPSFRASAISHALQLAPSSSLSAYTLFPEAFRLSSSPAGGTQHHRGAEHQSTMGSRAPSSSSSVSDHLSKSKGRQKLGSTSIERASASGMELIGAQRLGEWSSRSSSFGDGTFSFSFLHVRPWSGFEVQPASSLPASAPELSPSAMAVDWLRARTSSYLLQHASRHLSTLHSPSNGIEPLLLASAPTKCL